MTVVKIDPVRLPKAALSRSMKSSSSSRARSEIPAAGLGRESDGSLVRPCMNKAVVARPAKRSGNKLADDVVIRPAGRDRRRMSTLIETML